KALRAQQRAGAPRHGCPGGHHRRGGHIGDHCWTGYRHRVDGHHDAGNGWIRDHPEDPGEPGLPPAADRRPHGQGHEGRSREMPRGGGFRLPRQASQYRTAAFGAADVATPLRREGAMPDDRVNILLVDDQPANLLSYEAILRELDENLLTANSAQEAFEHLLKADVAVVLVDVCMPELDGFQLARMVRE